MKSLLSLWNRVSRRSGVVDALTNLSPVLIYNASGESIPPFSLVEVVFPTKATNDVDYALIGNDVVLNVIKPTSDTLEAFATTGAIRIPNGKTGIGYVGSILPVQASAGAAIGDHLSPAANSFTPRNSGDSGSMLVYAVDPSKPGLVLTKHSGGSGGSGGNTILFEILAVSDADAAETSACVDRLQDAAESYEATVLWRPCGTSRVPEETDDGTVIVYDELGSFLLEREAAEVGGRMGVATYMEQDGVLYPDCRWVITFIDWWREIQVIHDVIHTADEIRFKVKKVKVWDDCDLDDIVIPLTDCAEDYYG